MHIAYVSKFVRDVQRKDSGMLRDVAEMAKLWVERWPLEAGYLSRGQGIGGLLRLTLPAEIIEDSISSPRGWLLKGVAI